MLEKDAKTGVTKVMDEETAITGCITYRNRDKVKANFMYQFVHFIIAPIQLICGKCLYRIHCGSKNVKISEFDFGWRQSHSLLVFGALLSIRSRLASRAQLCKQS